MKVIRTFVAILIADDLRKNISEVQEHLKKLAPDVKWVAPKNLHVTLKFLGNLLEEDIPDVCKAVENAAKTFAPFDISFDGLGSFPNPSKARVVWVGIERGREKLIQLASSVDDNLSSFGFEREDRAFAAHITIGRVKDSRNLRKLADEIEKADVGLLGNQHVEGIAVMQSDLQREGPVYSPIKIIKFWR